MADKKYIDELVESFVDEMFANTNKALIREDDTIPIKMAKRNLSNAMQKYFDSSEKNKSYLKDKADYLSVNLDKGAARDQYIKSLGNKPNYNNELSKFSDELKGALQDIRDLNDPTKSAEEKITIMNRLGGAAGVRKYKDIADRLSLTPGYDVKRAKESGINNAPYDTRYLTKGEDGNLVSSSTKPSGEVAGYDISSLSLTNVPKSEICSYFKSGTRQNHRFAENKKNPTYGQMAEMAKNGDEEALSQLRNLYSKAMFDKILNGKFGYDFKIPASMYTYGNAKLPNDTLIVNFTSAHRCPAWKECLVGYACYARGSEHNYESLYKKNANMHLMWSAAHQDKELLDAMLNVIRMHLVNPVEMANTLLNNPETCQKWYKILIDNAGNMTRLDNNTLKSRYGGKKNILAEPNWSLKHADEDEDGVYESVSSEGNLLTEAPKKDRPLKKPTGAKDNLSMMIFNGKFSDMFNEDELNILKSNPKIFKAHFVRLNEEGDFIGQWLLDAFDEFAGELKLLGISVAAYTCRNLNFTAIKNIIINASTTKVGTAGEENGNVSNAIARRFFAVSKSMYDSLEDTYLPNGKNFEYEVPAGAKKGKEYDGSKPLVPLHQMPDGLHVKYDLKSYTNDGSTPETYTDRFDPNGSTVKNRLYYKCPCGRYGDSLVNGKPIKMDCYLCRMCYEPKNLNVGEIYVLVEVHGDNTDSFNMNAANNSRGISDKMATYKEEKAIFANRLCEEHKNAEEQGMELVSANVIQSAKDRIQKIADGDENALKEELNKFFSVMNSINEIDKKRKNNLID